MRPFAVLPDYDVDRYRDRGVGSRGGGDKTSRILGLRRLERRNDPRSHRFRCSSDSSFTDLYSTQFCKKKCSSNLGVDRTKERPKVEPFYVTK